MSQPHDTEVPAHLVVERTDRGFGHLPAIPSEYGGTVRVYESSAATGPHIWLTAEAPVDLNHPDGPMGKAPMHLTLENAQKLAEQIQLLVANHYQVTP